MARIAGSWGARTIWYVLMEVMSCVSGLWKGRLRMKVHAGCLVWGSRLIRAIPRHQRRWDCYVNLREGLWFGEARIDVFVIVVTRLDTCVGAARIIWAGLMFCCR